MSIYYGWQPFPTYLILDALDSGEYSALNDIKKDYVRIIISAGQINFRENSAVWDAMHTIFPDGTVTWTVLKALAERQYNPSPT